MNYQLPWPPTANHAHGRSGGRTFLSQRTKRYREDVRAAVVWADQAIPQALSCPLGVSMIFEPPARYRGDLDNLIKQTLDALQAAGVMADDRQVVVLRAEKGQRRKEGRVVVTLWIEKGDEYGSW